MDIIGADYKVRINGENVSPENAVINVFDHGFLYGDSIYEVIRTIGDNILAWDDHILRLHKSADRIALVLPWSDEHLKSEIDEILKSKDWTGDSFVRLMITRGVGYVEQSPKTCLNPSLIIMAKKLPVLASEKRENGLSVCLTKVRRNSREAMDPGIKSGNYLNNVMAIIEATEHGADDAVMLNEKGHLTECSSSNIYLIRDGKILTPSLDCGLLAGVTRGILLRLLRENGYEVIEGEFSTKDLVSSDEIFVSSSVRGVVPVKSICGEVEWKKGDGKLFEAIRDIYETGVGITPGAVKPVK